MVILLVIVMAGRTVIARRSALSARGAGLGALHALVCVRFGANQIVSGLGINLLAAGLTKLLLSLVFGSSANSERIEGIPQLEIPGLADWSVTCVLFCAPFVWLAILLVVIFARRGAETPSVSAARRRRESRGGAIARRLRGVSALDRRGALRRNRSAQPTAATVDESRGERGLTARSEVVQDRPLRWVESCLLRRR